MPRLLIVTYCFPPDFSVGGKRGLRMASHLATLGWTVEVLSARESCYERLDRTLVQEGQDYRVLRSHAILPKTWVRRLRSALGKRPSGPASIDPALRPALEGRKTSLSWLWDCFISIPDEWNGWLPPAFLRAVLGGGRPDIVLASGPPHTALLLGGMLARWWSSCLVLDYRDPWTSMSERGGFPAWRSRRVRALERWCVRAARLLVTTTPAIADSLRPLRPAKVEIVPNSFDPSLMAEIHPTSYSRFTVVYAGMLYPGRSPIALLRAVRRLADSGGLPPEGMALRVVGPTGSQIVEMAKSIGAAGYIETEDFLPHREALARMKGADVLLLIVGESQAGMVPAKLFEYLAARRFILALAPEGSEAARILAETQAGTVVPNDDEGAIFRVLSTRLKAGQGGLPGHPGLEAYESSAAMSRLDNLLRQVLEGRGDRTASDPGP